VDKMLRGDIGTAITPICAQEDSWDKEQGANGKNGWYNLSGQKVEAPTQHGIYIKDGKKILR